MRVFFAFIYICFCFSACSTAKNARIAETLDQGIKGYVTELVGNQMPSPDKAPDAPKGIKTRIYIYEATTLDQVKRSGPEPFYSEIRTKRIKTLMSDEDGFFAVKLPPGRYSVFTRVDGKYYANTFNHQNIIAPVDVSDSQVTDLNILISDKASF